MWLLAWIPLEMPLNVLSRVNTYGTFLSCLKIEILAVASRSRVMVNRHSENEKRGDILERMYGIMRHASWSALLSHPYMNTFCFLEWPCISQNRTTPLS